MTNRRQQPFGTQGWGAQARSEGSLFEPFVAKGFFFFFHVLILFTLFGAVDEVDASSALLRRRVDI